MSDTGYWTDSIGRVWHVVQKADGSVECNSNGTFTSAYKETWNRWKSAHGWKPIPPHNPEKEE